MLFFQVFLVAGYAYSHWISSRLGPRTQTLLHLGIVVSALLTLPIRPDSVWKPVDGNYPTLRILYLLAFNVGLPFFILSTTGPLIQKWQSQTHPARSPFRLFALSNFASLLALISYPFVAERFLTLDQQSWLWSGTFLAFAVSITVTGFLFQGNANPAETKHPQVDHDESDNPIAPVAASNLHPSVGDRPAWGLIFLWMFLPMLASVQLLATTNFMTQEIGSHPFLWILPLALYLISFIICFDRERWYYRPIFFGGLFLSSIAACWVLSRGLSAGTTLQISAYAAVCFFCGMCCHGELAKIKPSAKYLTQFYLLISCGGALGGITVAIIAPLTLVNYYEFHISLILILLVCVAGFLVPAMRKSAKPTNTSATRMGIRLSLFTTTLVVGFVIFSFGQYIQRDNQANILSIKRNEYGVLKVRDRLFENQANPRRELLNGPTQHGFQDVAGPDALLPSSYYVSTGGMGQAFVFLQNDHAATAEPGLSVAAIGLGTGTIAAWGRPQDKIRFYEINPAVEQAARQYFTFLEACQATWDISLGDARIQLEREAAADTKKYDLLVADAFSSDSIPIHLLTLEAMQLYKNRLNENGIIAIHTSNRYLRLENIVKRLADELQMDSVLVVDNEEGRGSGSSWVLVTNNQGFLDKMENEGKVHDWPDPRYSAFWTDDFSSLIPVIIW